MHPLSLLLPNLRNSGQNYPQIIQTSLNFKRVVLWKHSYDRQFEGFIVELVCPAGNLPSLKAPVNNGANAVYIGFKDETNARQFADLNFDDKSAQAGLNYAKERGVKVFAAINTYAQAGNFVKSH